VISISVIGVVSNLRSSAAKDFAFALLRVSAPPWWIFVSTFPICDHLRFICGKPSSFPITRDHPISCSFLALLRVSASPW
jgi:hypothetical protein